MKPTNKKRVTETKRKSRNRTSSVNSIENGISVLKYAIKKKLSVSAAAKEKGHGRNYVSDIKARLEENYKSKNISRELYNSFKTLSKDYQKAN